MEGIAHGIQRAVPRIVAAAIVCILIVLLAMLRVIVSGKVQLTTDGAERLGAGVLMVTKQDALMRIPHMV